MFRAGTIEIQVPECPPIVPNVNGIPSWVVGWGMGAAFVILLAFIIAAAIVWVNRQDNKTAQKKLDGQHAIQLAQQRKSCITCGGVYEPTLENRGK